MQTLTIEPKSCVITEFKNNSAKITKTFLKIEIGKQKYQSEYCTADSKIKGPIGVFKFPSWKGHLTVTCVGHKFLGINEELGKCVIELERVRDGEGVWDLKLNDEEKGYVSLSFKREISKTKVEHLEKTKLSSFEQKFKLAAGRKLSRQEPAPVQVEKKESKPEPEKYVLSFRTYFMLEACEYYYNKVSKQYYEGNYVPSAVVIEDVFDKLMELSKGNARKSDFLMLLHRVGLFDRQKNENAVSLCEEALKKETKLVLSGKFS